MKNIIVESITTTSYRHDIVFIFVRQYQVYGQETVSNSPMDTTAK